MRNVCLDQYRSLFEVAHGFVPEFPVGRVLPDQLLLLLGQLERLLDLHLLGRGLGRRRRSLCWRHTDGHDWRRREEEAAASLRQRLWIFNMETPC